MRGPSCRGMRLRDRWNNAEQEPDGYNSGYNSNDGVRSPLCGHEYLLYILVRARRAVRPPEEEHGVRRGDERRRP
jgi:hypothetical protein